MLLVASPTIFLCDYFTLKYSSQPTGSVQVQRYYAVTLKNKKTEFMFDPPEPETCVNSLFPHYGDSPCWYLARHKKQRVDIGAGGNPLY